jgi:hypothetical protein
MIDTIGWAATAVFVASYFSARAQHMRLLQMAGAIIWTAYGLAIGAPPVIVANVLVFSSAAWATWRRRAV